MTHRQSGRQVQVLVLVEKKNFLAKCRVERSSCVDAHYEAQRLHLDINLTSANQGHRDIHSPLSNDMFLQVGEAFAFDLACISPISLIGLCDFTINCRMPTTLKSTCSQQLSGYLGMTILFNFPCKDEAHQASIGASGQV